MNIYRKFTLLLAVGNICSALFHRHMGDDIGALWMMSVAILTVQAFIMTKPAVAAFR